MGFSVGDLEATLRLDRTPFQRGLDEARAEARRFEEDHTQAEVDVSVKGVEDARARLDTLRDRIVTEVDVDTKQARAELDQLERELGAIDHRTTDITVSLEATKAKAEVQAVRHEVDALDRKRVSIPIETRGAPAAIAALRAVEAATRGASRHVSGMGAAVGLGASALSAFTPLVGAAAIGVGAMGGAMTAAGIGTVLFGAVVKSTFTQVAKSAKGVESAQASYNKAVQMYGAHSKQAETAALKLQAAYKGIDPALRPLVKLYGELKSAWASFQAAVRPQVISFATAALNGIKGVLPQLIPLTQAAGNAFTGLAKDAGKALQSPFWQSFIHYLTRMAGPSISAFGHILGNLAHAFAGLVMAFEPQSKSMMAALVGLTKRFADWTTHLGSNGGFQKFIGYVRSNMPQVTALLKQMGSTIGLLIQAMAAGGGAALKLWVTMFGALNTVLKAVGPHIAGFVLAFGFIGLAAVKILGPVVAIVGWLGKLGPVMGLLGAVAKVLGSGLMLLARVIGVVLLDAVVGLAAAIGAPVAVVVGVIAAIIAIGVLVIAKWDWVKGALSAIWNAIKAAASAVWAAIKAVIEAAVTATAAVLTAAWNTIKAVTIAVWNAIKAVIEAVWNAIKGIVTGAVGAVKGVVTGAWDAVKGATSSTWNEIKGVFSSVWEAIKHGVSAGVGAVVNAVKGIPGKVLGVLKDLANSALDAGKAIVQAIANGVMAGAEWVMSAVRNVISQAKSLLPFSEPKDPSSPLRNLGASGRAILENVAAGVPAGLPALQAALRKASAGVRAQLDVGGGPAGPGVVQAGGGLAPLAAGGGTSYGDVHITMPAPVAASYTPDPAHLRALLSEELRKLGRGR